MELNADQKAELHAVLKQHPIGINTDAIWEKCKTFADRQELSLGLHAAKQQGWMYKNSGLHFIVNDEVTKSVESVESVEKAPAVKEDPWAATKQKFELNDSSVKFSSTPPKALPEEIQKVDAGNITVGPNTVPVKVIELGSLGFGNLQRSKGLGAAALALYKFRAEDPLCLEDLVELTGAGKTSLYSAMTRLVVERYAEKDDTVFHRPIFRWSGLYRYPFKSLLPTDQELLQFRTVEDWRNYKTSPGLKKETVSESPVVVNSQESGHDEVSAKVEFLGHYTNVQQIEAALKVIDAELALHKHQIEALTRLRDILQKP